MAALLAVEFGMVYAVNTKWGHYSVAGLVILSVCLVGAYALLVPLAGAGEHSWFAAVVGAGLAAATLLAIWRRDPVEFGVLMSSRSLRSLALYAALLLGAGWALRPRRTARILMALGVAAFAWFLVGQLWRTPHPVIDVVPISTEATQALLAGKNPYTEVYSNVYQQAGWVGYAYGAHPMRYVYLPGLLLHMAVPVGLGLDVRWMGLAMQVAGLILFAALAPLRGGGAGAWAWAIAGGAVLLFWVQNGQVRILEMGWTEALVLFYVCLALWAWRTRGWLAAAALVAAFCSKQTAWFCGPFFMALAVRERRWRMIAGMAVGSALLLAPFVLWDPGAFIRNVILDPAAIGPRRDALSWPAYFLRYDTGAFPWVARLSFLTYAIAFGGFIVELCRRERDHLMDAHKWMVLAIFGLLLFAKLAFFNYYYLLIGLLAFYIVRWARGDYGAAPEQQPAAAERAS